VYLSSCSVCVGSRGPSQSTERILQTIAEHRESDISDLSEDDEADDTFKLSSACESSESEECGDTDTSGDSNDEP